MGQILLKINQEEPLDHLPVFQIISEYIVFFHNKAASGILLPVGYFT